VAVGRWGAWKIRDEENNNAQAYQISVKTREGKSSFARFRQRLENNINTDLNEIQGYQKVNDTLGNRTCDLLSCSAVPQTD
jgi:hypothetical protein